MKRTFPFKHIVLFLTALFMSFLIPHNTVFAESIPADLKESSAAIQKMAEECYETEHSEKPSQINIDYDSAYGIYIDVDLFSGSSKSYREVMDLCKKAPVCYIVPVQVDEKHAVAEVSRGLPLNTSASSLLTEEEKEEIRNNEGKWIPASLTFDAGQKSMEQQTDDTLTQNGISPETDHCMVGGVPGIHDLILVADTRSGCVYIPFDSSISAAHESTSYAKASSDGQNQEAVPGGQQISSSSEGQNTAPAGNVSELKEGQAYSYQDFQQIAQLNRQYEQADDIVSGSSAAADHSRARMIVIAATAIIAAAAILIGIRIKKHSA